MESKILLIGRATEETNNLRKELRRQNTYEVNVATSPDQAINAITNDKINLLVFNTEILTRKKLAMTAEVRDLGGGEFPALILANSIMADTLSELEQSKDTVFLEKPFEVKDFFGITEKLISKDSVRQRIFRRFNTNQEGNFCKAPALDITTSVRIRNLSQGGAYIEYDGRQHIHIGDQIFLEIPLSLMKKEYKMRARVVWTLPVTNSGRNGLGVEFIR